MIPTFVIFLREGIEASMIIAILLAYLDRSGHRRNFRDVFWGVGAAVVLAISGGVAAYLLIHQYAGSRVQSIFEMGTYLLAAAALTYMTFWMNAHARTMSRELERRSDAALSRGTRAGMGLLAFTAVGREGLETMVFTLAIVFASSAQGPVSSSHSRLLFIGAFAGLALALAISFVVYRLGRRINLRHFFRALGITLMIFAAGLLADAVENLQQLGWLRVGRQTLWNTGSMLSESSTAGDLFHSLLGYAERPSVLQVVIYALYLVVSVATFVFIGRRRSSPPRESPPTIPTASSSTSAALGPS